MGWVIRQAYPRDAEKLHCWVKKLAGFVRHEKKCVSSPDDILAAMKGRPGIRAVFMDWVEAESENGNSGRAGGSGDASSVTAGFALWYYGFSTFSGKCALYLEDLYIDPEFRGRGAGREIMKYLSAHCLEEGCSVIQWSVLDWNANAFAFYRSLGAKDVIEWKHMSLDPLLLI